ncbi:MAG: TetR/AcrR family transcriptional regulator, partial [bacterium]|nr:TetR/AcrR family transcriptional regulator [bacterium]
MGVAERKEREKEQRRNAIIDAAEQVFFSKGIENATMDEVAKKAEFSKGTLYLYFKNKDELLHGIVGRGLEILFKMFQKAAKKKATGIARIAAIGTTYFEFYRKYPDYFSTIQHKESRKTDPEKIETNPNYARCSELGDKLFGFMQEAVATGIRDGSIRQDLDPVKLSLVLWGHSTGILNILESKEPIINRLFNLEAEEVVAYSHKVMIEYITP